MACTYNINGKVVDKKGLLKEIQETPEALFNLRNRPKDWVSIGEAKDIVKAWFPKAVIEGEGAWLKFIPSLLASQELNPATDIIAKIADGAVQLTSINNKVVRRALIHELMHLVYHYGMGPAWKSRVKKALGEVIDITDMSENDIEHNFAKLLELEESPSTSKIGKFIQQVKALFNFFVLNKRDIDTISALVRSGYFSKNPINIEPDYNANYADIKKHFGSFRPYILAKAWVMGMYEEIKDNSTIPLTTPEIVLRIQQQVLAESSRLGHAIERQKVFLDKMRTGGNRVAYAVTAEKIDTLTLKKKGIDMLARPSKGRRTTVLGVIMSDIFPNTGFDSEFKKRLLDEVGLQLPAYDDELLDMAREYDEAHKVGIQDETELRDASNEEAKLSTSVKEFLSFLSTKHPDKYSLTKYISSKWAFVRTMQLITDYLSLGEYPNMTDEEEYKFLKKQLAYIADNEPHNIWLNILVDKLTDLINTVFTPKSNLLKNVTVRVEENSLSRTSAFYSFVTKDPKLDLRELSLEELKYLVQEGSVSSKSISGDAITSVPILSRLYEWSKRVDSSIDESKFMLSYKHGEAVNTFNDLHNHLFSLVEKDYRVAVSSYPNRKYVPRYQKAGSVGEETNIYTQIVSILTEKLLSGDISPDVLDKSIIQEVDLEEDMLTLRKALTSPVDAIRGQGIAYFINHILEMEHLMVYSNILPTVNLSRDILELLKSLPTYAQITANIEYDPETKEENVEGTLEARRNYVDGILREQNRGRIASLTKMFSKNSLRLRNTSIQDSNKNSIYKYVVGSYGLRIIQHLSKMTNKSAFKGTTGNQDFRDEALPEHINNPEMKLNSIVNGKQVISDPITHESHLNDFTKKAYSFKQESERMWVSRNFIFGFLVPLISRNDKRYYQYSVQPSDGARIVATEMNILDPQQLKDVIKDIILQQAYRKNFLNKKLQWVNLSLFHNNEVNDYLNGKNNLDEAVEATFKALEDRALSTADSFLLPQRLVLPKDSVNSGLRKLGIDTKHMGEGRAEVITEETKNPENTERINNTARELWKVFYMNSYVNSYQLNQLIGGHPDNYGAADRVVKRQSGIWGPTLRPRIGRNGSKRTFKTWILSDTQVKYSSNDPNERSIEATLKALFPNDPKSVKEILDYFNSKGFKRTDGAGFMSKRRYSDLQKGFGRSFNLGKVMKPMMFQLFEKKELHKTFESKAEAESYIKDSEYKEALSLEESQTKEGTATFNVYVNVTTPIYFKYASIVLDDNLTDKYPALKKLADIMDKHDIDEVLFESSVKVGGTADTRTLADIIKEDNPSPNENAVNEFSNAGYGFQFNPTTKPVSTIANPSQMEYLANLLSLNMKQATNIYTALALIYKIKKENLSEIMSKTSIEDLIEKRIGGKGTERLGQILAAGSTINSPVIENKAISQLGSIFNTFVNKHRFKGSKLILQTAEGITKEGYTLSEALNAKADKLKKYIDEDGNMFSEAIVPKEMLTDEMIRSIKKGNPIFVSADFLGFRLPSSEIHSSVALKVVDFYEEDTGSNYSTNVVIIPSLDMEIQGADFDVDSLFVLIRDTDLNGVPVGYEKKEKVDKDGNKYSVYEEEFQTFDTKISKQLQKDPNNKELRETFIKFANNVIIENLIQISISERNRTRMTTPISMKDFQAKGDPNNGRAAVEKANTLKGLKKVWREGWDLSAMEDNFASFKAIKEGAQLIGIFANNLKMLAYSSKSGEQVKPGIRQSFAFSNKMTFDGNSLAFISEKDWDSKRSVWQTMDALINLAIDNAKELTLDIYNINTKNANIVSMLVAAGMPVRTLAYLTQTPIWENIFSDKFATVEGGLKSYIEKHDIKSSTTVKVTTEDLIKYLAAPEKDTFLNPEIMEIEKNLAVMLIELNKVSKTMLEVTSILSILRSNPATPQAIYRIYNLIKKNFKVYLGERDGKTEVKELYASDIDFGNKYSIFQRDFRFPRLENSFLLIPDLFNNHPHIAYLTKNFLDLRTKLVTEFKSHNPRITKFLSKDYGMGYRNMTETIENMRDSLKRFILGNIALQLMKEDGIDVSQGLNAWKLSFINKVSKLKAYEDRMEVKVAKTPRQGIYKLKYTPNPFLKALIVGKHPETGQLGIRMEVSNSFDGNEGMLMQDGFDDLVRYEIADGQVNTRTDIRPGERDENNFSQIQREFMYYNMITSGLSSGSTNYSTFINPDLYAHVTERLERIYDRLATDVNIQRFIAAFEIKALLQNLDNVPEIRVRNQKEDGTVYNEKSPITVVVNDKNPVFSKNKGMYIHEDSKGKKEVHYDLRFRVLPGTAISLDTTYLDMDKDEEDLDVDGSLEAPEKSAITFKRYIRKGKSLYRAVFITDTEVFYKRVGSARDLDTSIVEDPFSYNLSRRFNPSLKHIGVYNLFNKKSTTPRATIKISKDTENLDEYLERDNVVVYDNNNVYGTTMYEYKVTKNPENENEYILKYMGVLEQVEIKDEKVKTLDEALDLIIKTGKSPLYRFLAKRLKEVLSKYNIVIKYEEDSSGSSAAAIFDGETRSITIYNSNKVSEDNLQESILHEAIHAATVGALRNDTKLQRNLQELFNKLQEYLSTDEGRTKLINSGVSLNRLEAIMKLGPIELITYGLTDPAMLRLLNDITTEDIGYISKITNFFKLLLQKLAKAAGLLRDTDSTTVADEILYEFNRYMKSHETKLILDTGTAEILYQLEEETKEETTEESEEEEVDNSAAADLISLIRQEGDKWKEKEQSLDENGEVIYEADGVTPRKVEYTDGSTVLTRLTDAVRGIVNKFRIDPYKKYIDNKTYKEADALWENKNPEDELYRPEVSETPVDKETFISLMEKKRKKFANLGTASHLMIQAFVAKLQGKDPSVYIAQAQEKLIEVGQNEDSVNWVYEKAVKILTKSGVDLDNDKFESEITVASDIWGIASTIDLLVKHLDGTFSLIDFKFGKNLNTAISSKLFKYGVRNNMDIFEKRKNIAKLEIMIRALMLKTKYPDIKFKSLIVSSVPSKHSIDHFVDNSKDVEVAEYLGMIEDTLKEEYENSSNPEETIYGKLKKLPHFNRIFNPREYSSGPSSKLKKEIDQGTSVEALYRMKLDQLRYAVQYDLDSNTLKGISQRSDAARKRRREAEELTQELIELRHKAKITQAGWNKDISWMGVFIGSMRDLDSPLINIYSTLYSQQLRRATQRWEITLQIYRKKVDKVVDLYYKREGMSGIDRVRPITQDSRALRRRITNIDPIKFWEWAYVYDANKEDHIIGTVNTEEEWQKAAKKFPYLLKEGSKTEIREEYKDLKKFIDDSYEQFFVDSASHSGQALANRDATYRKVRGKERLLTNLELHLYPEGNVPKTAQPFFVRGKFFPKVPVTKDEVASLAGRLNPLNIKLWKYNWRHAMTSYIETEFLEWNNKVEGIPFRYLGNPQIEEERNYSVDMEEQFMQFVKYHIFKEEMEDVYAMGKGLSYLSDFKGLSTSHFWLEKSITFHLQGKKQTQYSDEFFGRQFPFLIKGKANEGDDAVTRAKKFDFIQLIRALKQPASVAIMGLKPFQGILNGVFTTLYTVKEAIKGDVLGSNLPGLKSMDKGYITFTADDLRLGAAEYFKMQKDIIQGNMEKNKMWLLLKELNYIPNHFVNFADKHRGEVHRGKLFEQSTLYMFHSAPEEFMAAAIMAAQLKNTKIKSNDSMNGKSMWDMYHVVEEKDTKSNESFFRVKWGTKQKDGSIANYIRFYENDGNNVVPVSELTPDEINRLYYVYQRMHGGYRPEERSILEYYVVGELFMQFRRFLPTVIRNGIAGRYTNLSYGDYKPLMGEDGKPMLKDGKEVMEWTGRIMEGRFRVLAGLFLNFISIRGELGPNGTTVDKIRSWIGLQSNNAYDWTNMSEFQKEVVVDMFLTFGFFMGIMALIIGLGADYDEEDPLMIFLGRVQTQFAQQWNIVDILKDVTTTTPVATKVAYYRVQAGSDLLASLFYYAMGDEEKALTDQGTPTGFNRTLKYMPYIASYYDFARYFLGQEVVDAETYEYLRKVDFGN